MRSVVLAAALLGAALPAHAATIVLDFEEEAVGGRENGYVSAECGCVAFSHSFLISDPSDPFLHVGDFGVQSDGSALLVGQDDDGGGLVLDFLAPVVGLSLDFGNDDEAFTDEGDEAVLQAFSGATLLGEARVVLNRNDVMDQSIALAGLGAFDRATFRYTDSIDEIVDNISFETVPEPGALALLAFVAAAGRWRGRVSRLRGAPARRADPRG